MICSTEIRYHRLRVMVSHSSRVNSHPVGVIGGVLTDINRPEVKWLVHGSTVTDFLLSVDGFIALGGLDIAQPYPETSHFLPLL